MVLDHGEAAGASLEHPHSQLIALPILPKHVVEELEGAKRYFSTKSVASSVNMICRRWKRRARSR